MWRRFIILEENKNGAFICRDVTRGETFGGADSLPEAIQVTSEWLESKNFEGDGVIMVKPWQAPPFSF